MAKSRKPGMVGDVRRPRRKEEPSRPREPADRAAEGLTLTRLARIPQENPDPVFHISAGQVLLYCNPAGEELCRTWGCHIGRQVPAVLRTLVSAALAEGAVAQHEVALASRTYWLTVAPSVADGYVNIYARDITDRKQAEEALRQAERKFRAIFDNTSDGILLLDLETRKFTMCNNSCLQMLGYTRDEFANLGIPDLHPQADLPFIYAQIEEFLKGGKPVRHDIRFQRKDGSILFTDLSPDLVLLDGKRYVVVALKDVTERKRMEEELRQHADQLEELVAARTGELQESERRYRSLAENDPDIIQRLDLDLRRLYVNPTFALATGVSPSAALGKTDRELGLPENLILFWEQVAHTVFRTGEDRIIEFEMPTPRGLRHYEAHLVPEFAPDGSVEHLLTITRDITERQWAEEAMRQLSRKNEEALRVARMGHWEFDVATGLFTFNDQYYTLHGTTAREAGGYQMTATDFARQYVHPDDAHLVQEHIQQALAADDPGFQLQAEARILRTDGEVRWVTVWFRAEKDAQGRTTKLYGVNQDITERKQAEEALRSLNERLELQVAQRTEDLRHTVDRLRKLTLDLSQAEDRERKRIADILHEDVQQTLAAAKFHLNLLDSEPRNVEEAGEIVGQVKHMLKDAIEKSRNLSHELSPALYQVELLEILNWLARHMQEKHGLTVRVEAHGPVDSPSEPLKAFLYKVAQELLFNVVKHAGVREARLRVRRMRQSIYLSVIDQGWGFDPQKLERAAGFGLLGIRERVQSLGGRMKIKSAPGAGSRFLIAVPYELAS